ncbi:MAG: sodium ion-translocating decarboxylase subunit beta, partial [Planctomycetales bacterium]|nr:sodium ion-translocating decarboxylase subunit beta [Planctomycetales bacterium]
MEILFEFLQTTGFALMKPGNAMMITIGVIFIALAIIKDYEPLLLLPIGFGIIVGNIPFLEGMSLSVYDDWNTPSGLQGASVLSLLYFGVKFGLFP